MPSFAIKTFGCRLNRAESAGFQAALASAGWTEVPFGEPAEVCILHTCAVTANAEKECLRAIRLARAKQPGTFLVVTGCAVEAGAVERLLRLGASLVVAHPDRGELPRLVLEKFPAVAVSEEPPPPPLPVRPPLKVQDGCSFFCSYCIVPHTRGAPVSRPLAECLDEAARLVAAGHRELVVTGCNLACYADGGCRLPGLLAELHKLPGLGRLRIGSLEPGINEVEIARSMPGSPKLCRFLHLPIQSGATEVLKRMGRRYTADELRRRLDEICAAVPRIGLGADLITGFPGETDEDFAQTRRLVEDYPFSNLHVFPYSERPGTPAAEFPGQLPVSERKRRAAELIELRKNKRAAFAASWVGREVEVLVERNRNRVSTGWTGEYLPVKISGVLPVGALVTVRVDRADGETLLVNEK